MRRKRSVSKLREVETQKRRGAREAFKSLPTYSEYDELVDGLRVSASGTPDSVENTSPDGDPAGTDLCEKRQSEVKRGEASRKEWSPPHESF